MKVSLVVAALLLVCSAIPAAVAQTQYNVDVDFFVMAKCPDAVFCEPHFMPALRDLSSIINLNVNYIANETAPDAFECRHGPGECMGDMQQLCARQYSLTHPELEENRRKKHGVNVEPMWYDFVLCQSNSSFNIPDNAEACAEQTGFNYSVIADCVNSGEGANLLSQSIKKITNQNDSISCTINLNEQFWCQHNGDWVGCTEGNTSDDLVGAICNRYTGPQPPEICWNYKRDHIEQITIDDTAPPTPLIVRDGTHGAIAKQ